MNPANSPAVPERAVAYDADYLQWLEQTVAQLAAGDREGIDWAHLIEELADTGKRERRSFESNLIVLLLHWLKWQYQAERRSGSWAGSIAEHRRRLRRALEDSPSLRPYLDNIFAASYQEARQQAALETELPLARFPEGVPYAIAAILDPNFWPEPAPPEA